MGMAMHKVFISHHHGNDQGYKEALRPHGFWSRPQRADRSWQRTSSRHRQWREPATSHSCPARRTASAPRLLDHILQRVDLPCAPTVLITQKGDIAMNLRQLQRRPAQPEQLALPGDTQTVVLLFDHQSLAPLDPCADSSTRQESKASNGR